MNTEVKNNCLTERQFAEKMAECREVYAKKLADYGAAWRIMRPQSITDQIYIKIKRVRTLQTLKERFVNEGQESEFVGIINYAVMALVQLERGYADKPDLGAEDALALYDAKTALALDLMARKNHDYGEAWREMRVESITDLIMMKVHRTKEIEDNGGKTIASEGQDANYLDMINYSVFALIKLSETTRTNLTPQIP